MPRGVQGWVGGENALMDVAQPGSGVGAECVGEHLAGVLVGDKGLGLTAATVLCQHQLPDQPLVRRMRRRLRG